MTPDSLYRFLTTTDYFEDTDPSGLLDAFEIREVPAGTVLFDTGDAGDAWYLVVRGAVTIVGDRADGTPLQFATVESGDGFGEISLLDDNDRSARAVVAEDAVLAVLPRDAFHQLLAEGQPAAVAMLRAISTRLSQRLRELSWIMQHFSAAAFGSLSQSAIQTFLKTMMMEH